MKKISLYLHQDVVDVLKCFGELNDIINLIIEVCVNTDLTYGQQISSAPSREDAKRFDVYVKKDLIESLGDIRVRPLIYWFVENEIYSDLEWVMTRSYRQERQIRLQKQFDKTIAEMNKLNDMCDGKITDAINHVERIRMNNGTQ